MHARTAARLSLLLLTVIVHKQDGKPRFDWVERNGMWAQVPVTPR